MFINGLLSIDRVDSIIDCIIRCMFISREDVVIYKHNAERNGNRRREEPVLKFNPIDQKNIVKIHST